VVCPADKDNFHWWLLAEDVIRDFSHCQRTAISQHQAAEDVGAIQAAETQKRRCKASRHPAGTVYATSGLRTSVDHWVLDWALVKLDANRFAFQKLHNVGSPPPLPLAFHLLIRWQIPSSLSRMNFKANLNHEAWNDIDWTPRAGAAFPAKDSPMFKIGRTSGHTAGQLHDIDASVTIDYKQHGLVKGKVCVVRSGEPNAFASCGDSGALVLNGHAEAVGMVTAVAKGSVASRAAYVSPFAPIVENIKEILERNGGEKVEVEFL